MERKYRTLDGQERLTRISPVDEERVRELVRDRLLPILRGEDDTPTAEIFERLPSDQDRRGLVASALSNALAQLSPSPQVWARARPFLKYAEWRLLENKLRSKLKTAGTVDVWSKSIAGTVDLSVASTSTILLDREKEGAAVLSEEWKGNPTAFNPQAFRYRYGVGHDDRSSLAVLRRLDPIRWFACLRRAALPSMVSEQISLASVRYDELLELLRIAPTAIADDSETGDVAAVLLARQAIEFSQRVEERMPTEEEREGFRTGALPALLSEAVETIQSRGDGDAILRCMLLEHTTRSLHQPTHHRTTHATLAALQTLADAVPDSHTEYWEWYLRRSPKQDTQELVGWLGAVLVADKLHDRPDDCAWLTDELLKVLEKSPSQLPHGFRNIAGLRSWVLPTAALPLMYVDNVTKCFTVGFNRLERERQRERLRPRYENTSTASRIWLGLGLGVLARSTDAADDDARKELWTRCWWAARQLWLRAPMDIGDDIQNLLLYAVAHLPLAHSLGAREVREVLETVAQEPLLGLEVARVWQHNGSTDADIRDAFRAAGFPLRDLMKLGETMDDVPQHTAKAVNAMLL